MGSFCNFEWVFTNVEMWDGCFGCWGGHMDGWDEC